MKRFRNILALTALFVVGCNQAEDEVDRPELSPDSHRNTVAKFQDGQKRFRDLIATVRDEKSFDAAKPELDKIVANWREIATTLGELDPPSKEMQAELREMITEGHRATEPSGEDMLSLVMIESREAEVSRWLEDFVAAAGAAGLEMDRLYGLTDATEAEVEVPESEK